jgi:threonine dehydratase
VRTIADTLAPRAVSDATLQLTQRYVDDIILVDDASMIDAMRWLWLNTNQLVEPAGVAVIAALLHNKVDASSFHHPVALICGGNAAAETVWSTYEDMAATKDTLSRHPPSSRG